jgi:hypothetical protein
MMELIGPEDLKTNPTRYLGTARPPLLKDYFDEQLRIEIDSRRKQRLVKVSFGVEVTDVPM